MRTFHSTTSNNTRVTIPSGLGGKYHLIASVTFAAGADSTRLVQIRLNGATVIGLLQATNGVAVGAFGASVPIMYQLAAGDYVEVICYQYSTAALNITGSLSAHWVSL